MIEDPREVERKRLLGIEDSDGPTKEELADFLVEVVRTQLREFEQAHRIDIENLKPVCGKKNIEYAWEKKDDSECSNSCSDETGNEITLKARHAL